MKYIPHITIIILNWNGWEDTVECLESLYQIDYSNYQIILVDNASEDASIERIKEYCEGKLHVKSEFIDYNFDNKPIAFYDFSEKELGTFIEKRDIDKLNSENEIIVIKNDDNYGFAGGNNVGIEFVLKNFKSDYILLLNNDTVVDKNFLAELVEIGQKNKKIGFLGPKTLFYENKERKDTISFAGGLLNLYNGTPKVLGYQEIDNGQYDQVNKVDYVEGSCILINKKIFEKIGFLDTSYFGYWEEADLCIRGYNAGYISVYVPKSKIWHKVSASFNSSIKLYYYSRNKIKFMKKNTNRIEYTSFLLYFFVYGFWFTNFYYFYSALKEKSGFDRNKNFIKGIFSGLTDY
jgi:Predicted glycosyltransferases